MPSKFCVILVLCLLVRVEAGGAATAWEAYGGGPDHSSFGPVSVLSLSNISVDELPGHIITGRMVWTTQVTPSTDNDYLSVLSYPTYANDRIYVTTPHTPYDAYIIVLNATTGEILQKTPVTTQPKASVDGVSPPILSTTLGLYFVQSYLWLNDIKAGLEVVVAYHLCNDSLAWNVSFPGNYFSNLLYGPTVYTPTNISRSILYVVGKNFYALDAKTGGTLSNITSDNIERLLAGWTPTIYHERVFVNADRPNMQPDNAGLISEISLFNNTFLWSVYDDKSTLRGDIDVVPVVQHDIAYTATKPTNQSIVALHAININTHQHYIVGPNDTCLPPNIIYVGRKYDFSPSVDDTYIYMTCRNGVHRYDPNPDRSGDILIYPCGEYCAGSSLITSDLLIVSGSYTTLVYNKTSTQLLCQLPSSGYLAINPQTGHIIIANERTGNVTVFQLQLTQAPPTTPPTTSPSPSTTSNTSSIFSSYTTWIGIGLGVILICGVGYCGYQRCKKQRTDTSVVNHIDEPFLNRN